MGGAGLKSCLITFVGQEKPAQSKARMGRGRARWGGSEKFKLIPVLPRGAGLKSCPITFAGRGKPARSKAGKGRGGVGQNYHPQDKMTILKVKSNFIE